MFGLNMKYGINFELSHKKSPLRASNSLPVPANRLSKKALRITIQEAHGKQLVENMTKRLGKILPPSFSEEVVQQLWRDAAHSPVAGENFKLQGLFSMFPTQQWDASLLFCADMPSTSLDAPEDSRARMIDMPFEKFDEAHLSSKANDCSMCRYVVALDAPDQALYDGSEVCGIGACRMSYHQKKQAPVDYFFTALWDGLPLADKAHFDWFLERHQILKSENCLGRSDEPGTPFQLLMGGVESTLLTMFRKFKAQKPGEFGQERARLVQGQFLAWVEIQIDRVMAVSKGHLRQPQAPLRMALLKYASNNLLRNIGYGYAQVNKASALNMQQGYAQDGKAALRFETLDAINALEDRAYAHTLQQIVQAVMKDVTANFGVQQEIVSDHDVYLACDLLAGYCTSRDAGKCSGFATSRMLAIFLALVYSDKCMKTQFNHQVPGRENPSLSAYLTLKRLVPNAEAQSMSVRPLFLKADDAPVSISETWGEKFHRDTKKLFENPEQNVDQQARFSERVKDLAAILLIHNFQQSEQFGYADSVCFNLACQVVNHWENRLPEDAFTRLAETLSDNSGARHVGMITCRKMLEGNAEGYDVGLRSLRAFYSNRFTFLADWSVGDRPKCISFQAFLLEDYAVQSIQHLSMFMALGLVVKLDVEQLTLFMEEPIPLGKY